VVRSHKLVKLKLATRRLINDSMSTVDGNSCHIYCLNTVNKIDCGRRGVGVLKGKISEFVFRD
jgi:hypothetical protein